MALHETTMMGMTLVSDTPGGDPLAAYWRGEHCWRIRMGEGADMTTVEANSPPGEPEHQPRPRVRETISAMLGL